MSMRNKKPGHPPPPLPRMPCDVIDNKGQVKKRKKYPTMPMITRELYVSLCLAVFYFHQDILWKSLQMALSSGPTHDVYDQKGFSLKIGKTALFFSMRYSREDGGVFASFCVSGSTGGW